MKESTNSDDVHWNHVGHCVEGQAFEIGGINVWSQDWRRVPGVTAEVKDPLYAQSYRFDVYEIVVGSTTVRFAAGDYFASVYGFYIPQSRGVLA